MAWKSRSMRWAAVGLYLSLLFSSLPWVPYLDEAARQSAAGWHLLNYGSFYLCGALLALAGWGAPRPLKVARAALLAGAAVVTLLVLLALDDPPAERIHLPEYGFLSALFLSALAADLPAWRASWLAWLMASAAGVMDECLQLLLPSRVFDWRDMLVNVVAASLGIIAALVAGWAGKDGGAQATSFTGSHQR